MLSMADINTHEGCVLTVCCMTHNHRDYIRKSLDSILEQKVNFPYKVIIHDDCSDDGTSDIVREYAAKYPELITPIIQKENQYKKTDILRTYVNPLIEGRYFALVEADDYWCDENKLQLQFDYMESHPECAMCTHNSAYIYRDGSLTGELFNTDPGDADFDAPRVIRDYGGILFHTSSYFCRSELYKAMPKPYHELNFYDYPIAIYMSTLAPVHYIDRVMSRYRVGDPSSWTGQTFTEKSVRIAHNEHMIEILNRLDDFTGKKYTEAFHDRMKTYTFKSLVLKGDKKAIFKDPGFRHRYIRDFCLRPVLHRVKSFLSGK